MNGTSRSSSTRSSNSSRTSSLPISPEFTDYKITRNLCMAFTSMTKDTGTLLAAENCGLSWSTHRASHRLACLADFVLYCPELKCLSIKLSETWSCFYLTHLPSLQAQVFFFFVLCRQDILVWCELCFFAICNPTAHCHYLKASKINILLTCIFTEWM